MSRRGQTRAKKSAKRKSHTLPSAQAQPARDPRNKAVRALIEWQEEPGTLPESYGRTKVVILPVNPYLVHVYWEVAPGDLESALKRVERAGQAAQAALRFYDITHIIFDGANAHSWFDVDIDLRVGNWYVHLWSPEKSYCVDLGLRTADSRWFPIARSNVAETPRAWPGERVDDRPLAGEVSRERGAALPTARRSTAPQEETRALGTEHGGLPAAGGYEQAPRPTGTKGSGGKSRPQRANPGVSPGADQENAPLETRFASLIDPLEIIRRVLAGISGFRWPGKSFSDPSAAQGQSVPAQREGESSADLTEMNERSFVSGISSQKTKSR